MVPLGEAGGQGRPDWVGRKRALGPRGRGWKSRGEKASLGPPSPLSLLSSSLSPFPCPPSPSPPCFANALPSICCWVARLPVKCRLVLMGLLVGALSVEILLFSEHLSKKKCRRFLLSWSLCSSGVGETDDELARVTSNNDEGWERKQTVCVRYLG